MDKIENLAGRQYKNGLNKTYNFWQNAPKHIEFRRAERFAGHRPAKIQHNFIFD